MSITFLYFLLAFPSNENVMRLSTDDSNNRCDWDQTTTFLLRSYTGSFHAERNEKINVRGDCILPSSVLTVLFFYVNLRTLIDRMKGFKVNQTKIFPIFMYKTKLGQCP